LVNQFTAYSGKVTTIMPFAQIRGIRMRYEIVGESGAWVALITGGRRGYDEFVPSRGGLPRRAIGSCCTTGAIPAPPIS